MIIDELELDAALLEVAAAFAVEDVVDALAVTAAVLVVLAVEVAFLVEEEAVEDAFLMLVDDEVSALAVAAVAEEEDAVFVLELDGATLLEDELALPEQVPARRLFLPLTAFLFCFRFAATESGGSSPAAGSLRIRAGAKRSMRD